MRETGADAFRTEHQTMNMSRIVIRSMLAAWRSVACSARAWRSRQPPRSRRHARAAADVKIETVSVAPGIYMLMGRGGNIGLTVGVGRRRHHRRPVRRHGAEDPRRGRDALATSRCTS